MFLPIIFLAFLLYDKNSPQTLNEKIIYFFLSAVALLLSIPVAYSMSLDNVGASLSGFISLFSN